MDVKGSVKSFLFCPFDSMETRKECQWISISSKTTTGIPKSIIQFKKSNLAILGCFRAYTLRKFYLLHKKYDRNRSPPPNFRLSKQIRSPVGFYSVGGFISGCLICATLIDFYYFVVNLPLRNYFFQMNNEKSANKTKRLGFGAYTGARHKDDFVLVWNCWKHGNIFGVSCFNREQSATFAQKWLNAIDTRRTWV